MKPQWCLTVMKWAGGTSANWTPVKTTEIISSSLANSIGHKAVIPTFFSDGKLKRDQLPSPPPPSSPYYVEGLILWKIRNCGRSLGCAQIWIWYEMLHTTHTTQHFLHLHFNSQEQTNLCDAISFREYYVRWKIIRFTARIWKERNCKSNIRPTGRYKILTHKSIILKQPRLSVVTICGSGCKEQGWGREGRGEEEIVVAESSRKYGRTKPIFLFIIRN